MKADISSTLSGAGSPPNIVKSVRKPNDGFLATFVAAPLAEKLVRRIANTKISPNQLTAASTVLSVVGANLLARRGTVSKALGFGAVGCGFIFDCADGQLARHRNEQTTMGMMLDETSDRCSELVLIHQLAKRSGQSFVGDMATVMMLNRHCLSRLGTTKVAPLEGADPTRIGSINRELRAFSQFTIGDRLLIVAVGSLASAKVGVVSHAVVGALGLSRDLAARQVRDSEDPTKAIVYSLVITLAGAGLAKRFPTKLPILAALPYALLTYKRLEDSRTQANHEDRADIEAP